jgi:hypothetical protein
MNGSDFLAFFLLAFDFGKDPRMQNEIGLGPYSASAGRSKPQQLLAKLVERARLKAALTQISSEIDAALPTLSASDLSELRNLMQSEIQMADQETEDMRAEIEAEAALAAHNTRAMQIQISRRISTIIAREVERRVARGLYPSAQALVSEAIVAQFGP